MITRRTTGQAMMTNSAATYAARIAFDDTCAEVAAVIKAAATAADHRTGLDAAALARQRADAATVDPETGSAT